MGKKSTDVVFPNQDPRWPQTDHFEPTVKRGLSKGSPRCQRWNSNRSRQCGNACWEDKDYCWDHGGAATEKHRTLKTRRDFIAALNEAADEQTKKSVNELGIAALAKQVMAGDIVAIKYWFDQQFGGPTTTIINEIVNKDLFIAFVAATAPFVHPDKEEEWLEALQAEIAKSSESKRSLASPEQ